MNQNPWAIECGSIASVAQLKCSRKSVRLLAARKRTPENRTFVFCHLVQWSSDFRDGRSFGMELTFSNYRTRKVSEEGIAQELKSRPTPPCSCHGKASSYFIAFGTWCENKENMSKTLYCNVPRQNARSLHSTCHLSCSVPYLRFVLTLPVTLPSGSPPSLRCEEILDQIF